MNEQLLNEQPQSHLQFEEQRRQEINISQNILEEIKRQTDSIIGVTSSPSTTLTITIDIREDSKGQRVLGQMVYVIVEEDGQEILVIGQIVSVETQNRWHEDAAFKGVIKRHGKLPHLSGTADNRVATISVQACYNLGKPKPEGYILGTSPSTGEDIQKMMNPVMQALMKEHEKDITYMGKVYGTDVDLPFWFKHFDKTDKKHDELGAGDAYHIGVFGKTGSGKTVTASYMLLGYAKNKNNMNILVLDPQGQFYNDQELVPGGKLEENIKTIGLKYHKYRILEDLYLPGEAHDLFAGLLQKNHFIKRAFNILSDRESYAADAICAYLSTLWRESRGAYGNLNVLHDKAKSLSLMKSLLTKFTETEATTDSRGRAGIKYNKYIDMIYSMPARKDQLIEKIKDILANETSVTEIFERNWQLIVEYFTSRTVDGKEKVKVKTIIEFITNVNNKGNFVILDLSGKNDQLTNENIKALFVKTIENEIKLAGEKYYPHKKVNCLVVMDEAHRYIAHESSDPQIVELTNEIVDAVRTTRKYGIGYMFITQTIESLDAEILKQTRIFAFGYGLTTGPELRKVSELINSDSAIQLYRSFIDPSSNNRFPFMFYGPVSPLSFTGSPLFIEVYTDAEKFR